MGPLPQRLARPKIKKDAETCKDLSAEDCAKQEEKCEWKADGDTDLEKQKAALLISNTGEVLKMFGEMSEKLVPPPGADASIGPVGLAFLLALPMHMHRREQMKRNADFLTCAVR